MKISTDTSASLGDKLAGLDLTDEEGVLLTMLLTQNRGDEVEGFRQPQPEQKGVTLGYTEVEWTYLKPVLGPLPGAWKVEEGTKGAYTEVEWT